MEISFIIAAIVAVAAVCFSFKKHKHRKRKCCKKQDELEQLNELLKRIEAYTGKGGKS